MKSTQGIKSLISQFMIIDCLLALFLVISFQQKSPSWMMNVSSCMLILHDFQVCVNYIVSIHLCLCVFVHMYIILCVIVHLCVCMQSTHLWTKVMH